MGYFWGIILWIRFEHDKRIPMHTNDNYFVHSLCLARYF